MSAYILHPEVIGTIATAVVAELPNDSLYDRIVADLCGHNIASIAARYPDTAGNEVETFLGYHRRIWEKRARNRVTAANAAIVEACREYEYQSCEHEAWKGSTAQQIVAALRATAEKRAAADRVAAAAADRQNRKAAWDVQLQNRPAWATHAIIAQFLQDQSDIQTDYFAHSVATEVIIGWSKHGRDLFAEMRKAAATFEPTRHLGPGCNRYKPYLAYADDVTTAHGRRFRGEGYRYRSPDDPVFLTKAEAEQFVSSQTVPAIAEGRLEWLIDEESVEHREKYSMGQGYYLGTSRHSGWVVVKRPI